MKTIILILLFSLGYWGTEKTGPAGEHPDNLKNDHTTVFVNVNLIPMDSERILSNQDVIVQGDRILSIAPTASETYPAEARIIEGEGRYLMPGLAEMHGHVPPTDPPANFPSYYNDKYVEHTLFLYVAAGVTTVRGMLGYENQLTLKERVKSGELTGPNLYLAGPSFNGGSVSSPEQARDKVLKQVSEGWDLLKIHPGLTLAEYDAMAITAKQAGIGFGGHVPQEVGIVHALQAGQETMDHIDGYFTYISSFEEQEWEERMQYIVSMTREEGAWIVPTQALWATIIGAGDYKAMMQYDELKYIPKAVRQNYENFVETNIRNNPDLNPEEAAKEGLWRQKILAEMHRQDVKILMGTDAPQLFSVPGFSIHRELPFMEDAGMSPYDIIRTGTKMVGDYFEDQDDFGILAEGMRADMILLEGNPLEDLSHIQKHAGVMVSGRWLSREDIDRRLSEIEGYYSE